MVSSMHRRRQQRNGNTERVRKTWDHLTREQLSALLLEHGKWARVARALGIQKMVLVTVRRRLGMLE